MSNHEIEVLTTDLEEMPVVQAWTGLGYAVPDRVEILHRKQKSVIYRLVGVGRGESDVIVKSCLRDIAVVEQRIYADVLPHLQMQPLSYYGCADGESSAGAAPGTRTLPTAGTDGLRSADSRFCWLFLEDARGEVFEPSNPEHREAATRWLARLHLASAGLEAAMELPHRGVGHYLEHLQAARRTIRLNSGNPGLSLGDREVLTQMLDRLDFVEARWEEIEATCREMPCSLVHGDFAERNVRIRRNGAGLQLFVFDWEVSGWGLMPVDLAHADLRLYWSLVRDTWLRLDFETLQRQVNLCKLLRGGIAATNWTVPSLTPEWVEGPIYDLIFYYARMTESLRALGWVR